MAIAVDGCDAGSQQLPGQAPVKSPRSSGEVVYSRPDRGYSAYDQPYLLAVDEAAVYLAKRRPGAVTRIDLATRASKTVYQAPRGMTIDQLVAGGGRVGIGVSRGLQAGKVKHTQVLELSLGGGPASVLSNGRFGRRDLRATLTFLRDVDSDGRLLIEDVERVRTSPDKVRDTLVYRSAGTEIRELARLHTATSRFAERSLGGETVARREGDQLSFQTDRGLEIRDLASKQVRRLPPSELPDLAATAELDPTGRAVVSVTRLSRGGSFEVESRLVAPQASLHDGMKLEPARLPGTLLSVPVSFCGPAILEASTVPIVGGEIGPLVLRRADSAVSQTLIRPTQQATPACSAATLAVARRDARRRRLLVELFPVP